MDYLKPLLSVASVLFDAITDYFMSRGDSEEDAKAKAAQLMSNPPRGVDIDEEWLRSIAGGD